MIAASEDCDERSAASRRRQSRRGRSELDVRAERAEMLVQLGELSSARQALEGAAIAPGNSATLNELTNLARRLAVLRDPLPNDLVTFQPERGFELDRENLLKNLRSARRGAADDRGRRLFVVLGEQAARADVAVELLRSGQWTALSKPDGEVRGIVAGDVVRRLVGRTIAQQLSKVWRRQQRHTSMPYRQGRDVNVWPTSSKASPKRTPMPPSFLLVV